jgi:carbon monoxide dehydrogenase subunit G
VKVVGSYTFEAPLQTVWNALFDAEILARTLPGCDKLEREGNTFKGDINVRMGPVQGKFQGKVDIVDIKELESYTMVVDGRGPAGFGKATALLRVSSEGSGTRLDYDSDVQVGGKIASVGQRLIDASSRAIVKQSLESLHEQIKALPAAVAPAAAVPVAAPAGGATPLADSVPAAAVAAESAPLPVAPSPAAAGSAAAASAAGGPSAASSAEQPWFDPKAAAAASAPDPVARAQRAPARGPSQAAFALGVAKEVTKELFPTRVVLLVIGVLVLGWLVLRSVNG